MSTPAPSPGPLPRECSCNYGDDRTGKFKMSNGSEAESTDFCWASLQQDPKNPGSYLQCQDISKDDCDDSVDGVLGITCQYVGNKCAISSASSLGTLKCVDPKTNPATPATSKDCKLRGMSGSDCRGCLGDGTMNTDNTVPKPIVMPSSITNKCPSPSPSP